MKHSCRIDPETDDGAVKSSELASLCGTACFGCEADIPRGCSVTGEFEREGQAGFEAWRRGSVWLHDKCDVARDARLDLFPLRDDVRMAGACNPPQHVRNTL